MCRRQCVCYISPGYTVCSSDFNSNLIKIAKRLFIGHNWPPLKCSIFWGSAVLWRNNGSMQPKTIPYTKLHFVKIGKTLSMCVCEREGKRVCKREWERCYSLLYVPANFPPPLSLKFVSFFCSSPDCHVQASNLEERERERKLEKMEKDELFFWLSLQMPLHSRFSHLFFFFGREINFIDILRKAFKCANPKSAKRYWQHDWIWDLCV